MPKESTIQHYNSSVTGNAPSSGDLSVGEIAINTSDEKVFLKNLGGTVLSLSQTKDLSGTFAFKNQVVSSLNSLTGGLFVTGTANEVEVSASSPNIVVGLPDSVTINNLTVTQNITAEYFVGSLLGKVTVPCKNVESYTLTAGTPVYISGYVGAGASGLLEVKAALAASAAAMPAVGLVEQTLAPNDQGDVVELGLLGSLDTSAFVAGQVAFIAPSGGLTSTRPTSGSHLVQNIGRIVNSSSNQGQIIVLGPGRSNDVPNNITVRGYLEMPNGQTATSLVTTFNGASGAILYSPSLATTSATGVASFNSTYFSVSSGAVSLASAYQATGDTVVGSANIGVTRVGNSVTVTNAGIREFNGLTGTVTLAGDSGSVSLVSGLGVGDNYSYKITNRVASTSLTGVASFDPNTFSVSGTGHVAISTTNATPLGFRDSFGTSLTPKWGSTVTLTGGSGVEVQNTASNVLSFRGITASTSTIGVASFNSTYFSVSSGAVSLASAYQATGDTVITTAGSGIAISTSGKTDTLFNIGVTSFNGSTGAVSYAPPLASASVTGVAHFPSSDFAVSATGSVTLSNVARTNAANTFSGLQTFSNGLSAHGATFGSGSVVRLSGLASFPQVDNGGGIYSGGSIAGEAVNNVYFVAGQGGSGEFPTKPYITFQNNSVDTGADINFSTQGGDVKFTANTDIDIVALNGNVNISSASGGIVIDPVTFVNIAGGVLYVDDTNNRVGINDTTPSMALCVNGGISGGSLIVAAGATFNSRANFAAGLTTANLFVSGGGTFGGAVSITGFLAATGATFNYNMSLGPLDKNLLKDATFKDFGEVFGYQVRKEIKDVKTNNRYYVDLSRGNTFYLDLQGSDNSGTLGGYAPGDNLPSVKVPSTAWATVTTTVGLTGATASTINQGGTIAAGQFMFGPGITSTGCTAVSYNSGTGVIVLSKAAQATVSNAYTAFVRNNGEGYGMGASPVLSTASTLAPARIHSFTLIVGATASASITWQTGATHYGNIKWPSGTAPTLTTTRGNFDVFSFLSYDYGTSWLAFNAGQNF